MHPCIRRLVLIPLLLILPVLARAEGPTETAAVGTWHWFNNDTVTLRRDHTVLSSGRAAGTWKAHHHMVEIVWQKDGWVDRLQMSMDGNMLDGGATHVSGTRADDAITGTWSWFNGHVVTIFGDNTSVDASGGEGVWRAVDPRCASVRDRLGRPMDRFGEAGPRGAGGRR